MKTYIELEQLGIIAVYTVDDKLRVITKGGDVWAYFHTDALFSHLYTL